MRKLVPQEMTSYDEFFQFGDVVKETLMKFPASLEGKFSRRANLWYVWDGTRSVLATYSPHCYGRERTYFWENCAVLVKECLQSLNRSIKEQQYQAEVSDKFASLNSSLVSVKTLVDALKSQVEELRSSSEALSERVLVLESASEEDCNEASAAIDLHDSRESCPSMTAQIGFVDFQHFVAEAKSLKGDWLEVPKMSQKRLSALAGRLWKSVKSLESRDLNSYLSVLIAMLAIASAGIGYAQALENINSLSLFAELHKSGDEKTSHLSRPRVE